jgi:YidC/Oxa1 family membrane protein insertase
MALQRLQPKIKEIQELHKNDKQKQTEALMALYKEHGVNPFLSLILIVVQLPILLALYRIILSGLGASGISSGLYSFISAPNAINPLFLGFFNLAQRSIVLVLIVAIAQYFQSRLAIYQSPNAGPLSPAERMARQMAFIGPIITVVIFYNLPAGVGLYWLISSIFSIIQQLIVNRHLREKYGA